MWDMRSIRLQAAVKVISTPKFVALDITNRCNLHCKYCYHFSSPGDIGEDLQKEEWLQIFEELNGGRLPEIKEVPIN